MLSAPLDPNSLLPLLAGKYPIFFPLLLFFLIEGVISKAKKYGGHVMDFLGWLPELVHAVGTCYERCFEEVHRIKQIGKKRALSEPMRADTPRTRPDVFTLSSD